MKASDYADAFGELASRFDKIADGRYVKYTHIVDDIGQRTLIASELLNEAADAGLFPHYRDKLRGALGIFRYCEHTGGFGFSDKDLERIDWRKREGADRDSWLYLAWTQAIGSWLCKEYRQYFRADAKELDCLHKYVKPGTKYIKTEVRIPHKKGELVRYNWKLPEGSIVCVERDEYDAKDRLNRARARARNYADACRLLARLSVSQNHANDERVAVELTLTEAAEKYDVPKSAWSKAANKKPGEPGYLTTRKVGRNRFVNKDKAKEFADNYTARREQRVVGTKSGDPDRGIVVSALSEFKKKAKRLPGSKSQ